MDLSKLRANDKITFTSENASMGVTQILTILTKSPYTATATLLVQNSLGVTNTTNTTNTPIHWSSTALHNSYTLSFNDSITIKLKTNIMLQIDSIKPISKTEQVTIAGKMAPTISKMPEFAQDPAAYPFQNGDLEEISITPRTAADQP